MKKMVIVMCLIMPIAVFAQSVNESLFSNLENWSSVLELAKKENKSIFVDLYTTWCAPCKKMDAEVYTDETVASFLKKNFLSIKVQMDKTNKDPISIQNWYTDAAYLSKKYNVEAFPTFLFLSPNGEILQIQKGFYDADKFLTILQSAHDPKQSYQAKLKQFNSNQFPAKELLSLAMEAKQYKDDSIALNIARKYKLDWLTKQPIDTMLGQHFCDLVSNFPELVTIDDPLVKHLEQFPGILDSNMHMNGMASDFIDYFISRDLVGPFLAKVENGEGAEPDWKAIYKLINRRYNKQMAERLLLDNKLYYYYRKKDWDNAIKYEIEKIETRGLDTVGMGKSGINNISYNVIFKYSHNPVYLKKAIGYMEIILQSNPHADTWLDTYANLLYKSGRKEEAISAEEKAISVAKKGNKDDSVKEYQDVLLLMKGNRPTWE